MPATSGWATRSSASRPSRRRTNAPRLSSSDTPRGRRRSRAIRSLPGQEKSPDVMNGPSLVGARSWNPSGRGWRRPARPPGGGGGGPPAPPPTPPGKPSARRGAPPPPPKPPTRPRAPRLPQEKGGGPRLYQEPAGALGRDGAPEPGARFDQREVQRRGPLARELDGAVRRREPGDAPADDDELQPSHVTARLDRQPISPRTAVNAADQLRHQRDELGMIVPSRRAMKAEASGGGHPTGLDVEVVQHLDVIAHEADRHDAGVALAVGREAPEHGGHVRLEPRLARASTPALVSDRPASVAEAPRDGTRRRSQVRHVGRGLGHRDRHAVRREDQWRRRPRVFWNLPERCPRTVGDRGDEARVFEPRRREADLGRARDAGPRLGHVLHVALPRGLGAERREDDAERAPRSFARHLGERLVQERMPVPHSDEHGQRGPGLGERLLEPAGLGERELGERRTAARHLLVEVGDIFLEDRGDVAGAVYDTAQPPGP